MAHKTQAEAGPGEPYVTDDGFYVVPMTPEMQRSLSVSIRAERLRWALPFTDAHEPICGHCGEPWPCQVQSTALVIARAVAEHSGGEQG